MANGRRASTKWKVYSSKGLPVENELEMASSGSASALWSRCPQLLFIKEVNPWLHVRAFCLAGWGKSVNPVHSWTGEVRL